ncbi:Listeria/Bacterioides repeat-containing protein [Fibrobacter sp. UWT3]|uniref:InlB B-repeat-containing protein n=1 Tax=Fibrobacter sp. UWT3 TaxID=1896225 RepID=UPI000BD93194|nr:InlB B-repeat-containing protein [Fibrobacter sp. UWT3]SOE79493.1 Listeria/Bacterioides repeat-containing protein [Fibrobacter sp. UWT3]
MLKSARSLVCASVALSCSLAVAATITPEIPEKGADGCYEISTAAELYGFASLVNNVGRNEYFTDCAKLTDDIVVNEHVFTDEGKLNEDASGDFLNWPPMKKFAGRFDGQGHTISGLYVNSTSNDAAFIGYIQTSGFSKDTVVIENLGILASYFYGSYYSATFVGMINSNAPVRIENCYTNSHVIAYDGAAGGLVGFADKLIMKNSYNAGDVTGTERVGGIVGYLDSYSAEMVNVFNVGRVTATTQTIYVKPVVGYNWSPNIHENVFYFSADPDGGDKDSMGVAMSQDQFENGTVAYLLRNYNYEGLDASVWGQEIGGDAYPVLGKALTETPLVETQMLTLHTYEGDLTAYPRRYVPGFAYRLPVPTREGYTFRGWFNNAGFTGDSIGFVPASATGVQEFWALFKKVSRITYQLDGGTIDSLLVESYTEGVGAALPRHVSRNGYVFSGWYGSKEFSGHATDSVRASDTGNKVFYAKWFKKESPKQDENGCYEISNAAELYGFAALVNATDGIKTPQRKACGKLTKDIVVNKDVLGENGTLNEETKFDHTPWNPIDSFGGTFDGQGHTISGLFYDDTTYYGPIIGLFGNAGVIDADDTVTIRNVGLEGSFMRARSSVGAIVGQVYSMASSGLTIIENCYNASTLYAKTATAGGIVAAVYSEPHVYIVNCYNIGHIGGTSYTGGILGQTTWSDKATLVNCLGLVPGESMSKENRKALVSGSTYNNKVEIVNSYYPVSAGNKERGGYSASAEQVKNGALAYMLHNGVYKQFNGLAWGQNVGTDEYPVLSGEIENSEVDAYKVTFHTFEGDTAKYFDAYMPGFEKPLPDTVLMENGEFLGWFADADFSGSPLKVISKDATGELEFWAKINKVSGVRFVVNGGIIDSGYVADYTEGIGVQLPWRVSRDSCIFAGWYDNEELTGKPVVTITAEDTGDKTYYAAWFKMKMPELDEADNCYAISDAAELYGFAAFVGRKHGMSTRQNSNVCGKLTKDIVVNEGVLKDGVLDSANMTTFLKWEPISLFGGDFLGNGHKISGLFISRDTTAQGFISTINYRYDNNYNQIPIVVRDVVFEDTYFYGSGYVGGVFADLSSNPIVNITNVKFDGVIESKIVGGGWQEAGGLVGHNSATLTLDSCINMARVSGKAAAGLVGGTSGSLIIMNSANLGEINGESNGAAGLVVDASQNYSSSITNSYNTGKVTSTGGAAGLIAAARGVSMNISNSYNTAEIVGSGSVGGLVGVSNATLTFFQNYNTGDVRSTGYSSPVGGLMGETTKATVIANNYNLGNVSANTGFGKAGGLVGVVSTSGSETTMLLNNYSMGSIEQGYTTNLIAVKSKASSTLQAENNFYLAVEGVTSDFGIAASAEAFKNDSVANVLRAYVQKDAEGVELEGGIKGSAWIQGENYPELLTRTVFAIAFVLDGGVLENAPVSYEYGEGLTLPTPKRDGHEFKGWFENRFFSGNAVTEISAKDHADKVFYAKWQEIIYQVTVEVNNSKWGMVTGLNNDGKYKYGDIVLLTAKPNQGYELAYWGDALENNKTEIRITVLADTTVKANFAPIEPESSSSEESSSSSVKSSSSEASSSSSEPESSSSEDGNAIPAIAAAPTFSAYALGRTIQVAGARAGSAYAVFDLQGRVLRTGTVDVANFAVPVARSGRYLVRIGTQVRQVLVR